MRVPSISFRPGTSVVLLREDYLDICDGKQCPAMILAQMQYWHEVKVAHASQASIANDVARREGEPATQDTDIWVYKSQPEMQTELMNLFGERAVSEGFALLLERGFLEFRLNPLLKYDRTRQYRFIVVAVQAAINALPNPQNCMEATRKIALSKAQNDGDNAVELRDQKRILTAAIPETTSETTKTENTTEREAQAPSSRSGSMIKPTERELADFFRGNGSSGEEARKMWNHYQSNGWKVGRNPMKDWQASARGWIQRAKEEARQVNPRTPSTGPTGPSLADRTEANARAVEEMRASGMLRSSSR